MNILKSALDSDKSSRPTRIVSTHEQGLHQSDGRPRIYLYDRTYVSSAHQAYVTRDRHASRLPIYQKLWNKETKRVLF